MDKIVLSGFGDDFSSSLDRQIQVLKIRDFLHGDPGCGKEGNRHIHHRRSKVDQVSWMTCIYFSLASPIGKINIKDDFTPHLNILNMWLNWPMY